jgi:hypothetical protein
MLSQKVLRIPLALAAATCLLLSSCKKEKIESEDVSNTDVSYVADQAQLEKAYDDVDDIATQAAAGSDMSNYRTTSACAKVSFDSLSTPRKVTIDFGPVNCLCGDGVYRRGKIILTYTGRYRDSGYVHTVTTDSFFFNNNQLKGTRIVTNKGKNSSGQIYFDISVDGTIILDSSAGTKKWVSSRQRTWTAGSSTLLRADDEYSITGSGTVTRVDGSTFTATIKSPLMLALACDWIKQGTIEIVPSAGGKTRTLDYGSGTCDAVATVTVGSKTKTITLKR